MIISASTEEMRHRRRRSADNPNRRDASGNSTASVRTTYIGHDPMNIKQEGREKPDPDALSPMAFLIEQGANSTLNSHFHKSDQFQIFVNGDGRIADHDVTGLCFHFTGANSPYGPIIAGDRGLDYMTLRNSYIDKAYFMPGARDELRATPNREYREVMGDLPDLGPVTAVEENEAIPMQRDGLAVWRYRLPAGASISGPDPRTGSGQFWIVLGGELATGGDAPLSRLSCIFVSDDEAPYQATAGADGLDLLVTQFPRRTFDGTELPASEVS